MEAITKRRRGRLLTLFAAAVLSAGAIATPVAAHAASGAKTFLSGYVYDYWAQNHASKVGSKGISYQINLWKTTSNWPAGWGCIQGKLYDVTNAQLFLYTPWTCNAASTRAMGWTDGVSNAHKALYYSQGEAQTYKGPSGYDHWWPAATPYVSIP